MKFETYFKFAFVRNPWDRILSAFCFLKKGGRNKVDARWAAEFLAPYDTFDQFVEDLQRNRIRRQILKGQHFTPQIRRITNCRGEIALDFMGRFENLEEDFHQVAQHLGTTATLRHDNRSNRTASYPAYYTRKSVEIVREVYGEDIRRLGYTFDRGVG